jgi:hypothetical protein
MKRLLLFLFLLSSVQAQSVLESLDDALTLSSADGEWRADVSGLLDLEAYLPEEQALGLVETDDEVFFNPRLTLLFDFQLTQRWRAHIQMRTDRGFDPGFAVDGETRLDEYFIEWRPLESDVLNLRAGKFATAFGAWTPRRSVLGQSLRYSAFGLQ